MSGNGSSKVTAYISTKNRYYTTLPLAIESIALQTRVPDYFILFDDGDQKDLRKDVNYNYLFSMLDRKGIKWEVVFGARKGQVLNHQRALEMAQTDYIWRLDDDNIADSDVLDKLVKILDDNPKAGAVGSLVFIPGMHGAPLEHFKRIASSQIDDVSFKPNLQWYKFSGILEAQHLHNTFLYRKAAARGYCMELSPVGHREESLFTYDIYANGYKVLVCGDCITWHLRQPQGGIRSEYHRSEAFDHDEALFNKIMKEKYGVEIGKYKLMVLDAGLGDHLVFKAMMPEIIKRWPGHRIIIACCHPDIFEHDPVEILSIHEASLITDLEKHNVYKWMWDHNWKGSLEDAYRGLYLN